MTKSVKQRRKEAEERSWALLRAVVPAEAFHKEVILGRKAEFIEVLGNESGHIYRIFLTSTAENIIEVLPRYNGHRNGYRRFCGGPHAWNDYLLPMRPRDRVPHVDEELFEPARQEAIGQGTTPLVLPPADIWLGQYLYLKYAEERFLRVAVPGGVYYDD